MFKSNLKKKQNLADIKIINDMSRKYSADNSGQSIDASSFQPVDKIATEPGLLPSCLIPSYYITAWQESLTPLQGTIFEL